MIISLKNLNLSFAQRRKVVPILKNVSLDVKEGETLGIVGESGSGKSMLMRFLLGVLPGEPTISFDKFSCLGEEVFPEQVFEARPYMAMILQDSKFSLNPVLKVSTQLEEALRSQGYEGDMQEKMVTLLEEVHIREPRQVLNRYSFELSGGMGQRVMIAMMLCLKPKVLIADEPTSALDATIRTQILDLLKEKAKAYGMTLIMVSHDLPMTAAYCDRVMVMHQGQVVDTCSAKDLDKSTHAYTQGLLGCLPRLDEKRKRLPTLKREVS